jgi:hypothetical protein
MADALLELAKELWAKAYEQQMHGDLELAVQLYKRSIEMHPTAEAYTFLGWTYHFQEENRRGHCGMQGRPLRSTRVSGIPITISGVSDRAGAAGRCHPPGWKRLLASSRFTSPITIPGTTWAGFTCQGDVQQGPPVLKIRRIEPRYEAAADGLRKLRCCCSDRVLRTRSRRDRKGVDAWQ